MIDDLSIIHQLYSLNQDAENILFKPKDTYRMRGGSRKGSKTTGTNHPNGVITNFNLKNYSKEDKVALTYFDSKGDTIKTYSTNSKKNKLKVEKGANTFVWNMTYDGAERLKGMILWWASLRGPRAIPGAYKVNLTVNDETISQSFTILADPRAESSLEDMKKQFTFIKEVNKTMDEAHKSIKKIRKINTQLSAFEKQYKGDESVKDLLDKAKELKEKFIEIEETLYQTKNRSGQDPLNFPIRLTNKLGHLNSLVSMGDFAPTEQDVKVKDELSEQINQQLKAFNNLIDSEIKAFNDAFNTKKLNYLFIEN